VGGIGKPYQPVLLAFHKIAAVLAAVFLVLTALELTKGRTWNALEIASAIAAGLLFLGTIASGALLTAEKPMPAFVSVFHKVGPLLTVLASAAAILLLYRKR
jgi:hypothetical protein